MKKTVLVLMAAVFILSVGIGTADAAWITGFATAKKVLQNAVSTTITSASASTAVIYKLGAGETLNTNDTVVITLTNGGKFSSTVAPTITTSAGVMAIVGSPTGLTTANFRVSFLASVGDTLTFNTNQAIFDVSAVTSAVGMSVAATTSVGSLSIFNSATTTSPVGTATAFAAPSAMERVDITASTDVANVSETTGAFKKFTGATVTGTAATFSYTNLSTNTIGGGETAPYNSITAGKVVFNIAGALTGISSVSGTGCTGSSSTGSTTGGTANFFLIDTAKTNAYCVNTAAIAQLGSIILAPVFTLDGTTAQVARGFNAAVNFLVDGTNWSAHTALGTTALYSITRNGSSFVTNSVGPRNTIKITDRSGGLASTGGNITITAYDIDGTSIPFSGTGLTLQNNATTTIAGTALQALFPTGTAIRYDFAVESASIVVTNVKASTDGVSSSTTIFTSAAATATGLGQGI